MAKDLEAPLAQVSEGLSSSVFEIASPANIPADKSGHKARTVYVSEKFDDHLSRTEPPP